MKFIFGKNVFNIPVDSVANLSSVLFEKIIWLKILIEYKILYYF